MSKNSAPSAPKAGPKPLLLVGGLVLPAVFVWLAILKAEKCGPVLQALEVDLPALTRALLRATSEPLLLYGVAAASAALLAVLRLTGRARLEKTAATLLIITSLLGMGAVYVGLVRPSERVAEALSR